MEKRDLLGQIQNAFRKGKRGSDCIWMLTQIIESRKVLKKKVFIAFIDLRKAFDRVYRVGLWECLCDSWIGPKTINLLKDMYFHTRKKVE